MVCYWRGLPANKDWIRVDVVRSFEALPRNDLKDYVAVKRRKENEKTLNFVKKKSLETKLHNHDLDDAKVFEHHVKPNIHLVADHHDVIATTPKENSSWLSRFGNTIGNMALDALPILGTVAGAALTKNAGGAALGASIGAGVESVVDHMIHPKFGGTPMSHNPMTGSTSISK